MKTEQRKWTRATGWAGGGLAPSLPSSHLVLVFGANEALREPGLLESIAKAYPDAGLLGCSTAGEICDTEVSNDALVMTAVHFELTEVRGAQANLNETADGFEAGARLARMLPPSVPGVEEGQPSNLAHLLVLSDGLRVNGSDLVRGMVEHVPEGVTVTGGLAGDGERFGETLVFWNSPPKTGTIAVLGFYGSRLKVGFGSLGGWDPFGPERLITKSKGNVLFELDGHSALGLYKRYLGDHARRLPSAGLLFPLCVREKIGDIGVVRTVLSVDEAQQSMTFAGDMPEGAFARLMKANIDRLIDGATGAARRSCQIDGCAAPELAILISCVGRKLVLKQRVEEEVEAVREVLGRRSALAGFYSYGEISPFAPGAKCELHNQTMTITTLGEI